jgi:hypothetical protein
MLGDLGDVDMLVGSLKNIENVAGFERYITRQRRSTASRKSQEQVHFSPSCDRTEDSICTWSLISPFRDRVDGGKCMVCMSLGSSVGWFL